MTSESYARVEMRKNGRPAKHTESFAVISTTIAFSLKDFYHTCQRCTAKVYGV